MTSNESGELQPRRVQRQTSDASWVGIVVVAAVVFFVVNGPRSNASNRETLTKEPAFSSTAILGGIQRQNSSSAFRSADALAFMGGVKLDLRDATMEGNEAKIDVSAIMGGVEIRVPRTWTVINRVTPVMGGVQDHTHSSDSNHRLVIEGTVLMGGLHIHN